MYSALFASFRVLISTLSMMVSSTSRMDVLASRSRGANSQITGRRFSLATMIPISAKTRRSLLVAEFHRILLMLTGSFFQVTFHHNYWTNINCEYGCLNAEMR
jgi:hypothetical protein